MLGPPVGELGVLEVLEEVRSAAGHVHTFERVPQAALPRPEEAGPERLCAWASLPMHPGFGLFLTRAQGTMHVGASYRFPLASPEGVRDYLRLFEAEVNALAGTESHGQP